ncbi:hypothetical protein LKL35_30425 [Streptomyces sp. ET3-23]|uniref:hypothetical protein n=1 Tax=Streptomyces sp. ET3-23 TaxID=2885643 RepID=UPI001D11DFBB|nr:hypothetical protein [Streptomyces sp. ET3-23]MCC2279710.1 hypothetical protein [Streptomyces sp. ET3-23]
MSIRMPVRARAVRPAVVAAVLVALSALGASASAVVPTDTDFRSCYNGKGRLGVIKGGLQTQPYYTLVCKGGVFDGQTVVFADGDDFTLVDSVDGAAGFTGLDGFGKA